MRPLLLVLLLCPCAPAKDQPVDTSFLRLHAQTRGFLLGRPTRPKPTPDGQAVLFLRSPAREARQSLYALDLAAGKTRDLLTPEKLLQGAEESLTPEEKARRERQRISVGGFTSYQLSPDDKLILLTLSGRLYLVRRDTGAARELKTSAGTLLDPKFSPTGEHVSYVLDHDLYVLDLAAGKETRLTTGGSEKLSHGLAEFVAQEEMGRHTGYWWSPDARYLAYEEADAGDVELWHVADPLSPESPPHPSFYPRPGKANVKVRLGILPVTGGSTTWVEWDRERHPYLASVRWDKRGPLTLLVQTREQDEQVLFRADPASGKTTPLVTDRDPAWVDIHQDVPRWLADDRFLWAGQGREGVRLELREADGKLGKVLVPPGAGYRSLVDVDPKGRSLVYQASDDPTQLHLFRLSLDGGKPERLTREPGLHDAVFSEDHSIYVRTSGTPTRLLTSTVHRADGKLLATLPSVAEEPPFTPREELIRVDNGPGFYTVLIRPRDFDPGKKYPVIVHVYGGPTAQMVTASMRRRLIDQWLADQGFLVVSIDNRGTPGRERSWEKAISKRFGSVPLEDQVIALKELGKRLPEMDLERVGIYGWSFGGYMSALAVLKRPDVFKAAVAGAPVVDWLDYDTHYTERYLGLPGKNAAAYREASLLTYADALKRPLLLVHGTADDNVFFRHTLKLADALFRAGKRFDLLPLSGLTHMVPDPVVSQRLYGLFAGYFHQHLGGPVPRASGEKP